MVKAILSKIMERRAHHSLFSTAKSAALWASAFFWTLCILSIGFAAYVGSYPATAVPWTGTLSSADWNKMVSLLQNFDNRWSAVSIYGSVASTSPSTFSVSSTFSNSLLASNPTTSTITVPRDGTYAVTVIGTLCTTGANSYMNASIRVNGVEKITAPNLANACGSANVRLVFSLTAWNTVAWLCSNGQWMSMPCYMTVEQLQ